MGNQWLCACGFVPSQADSTHLQPLTTFLDGHLLPVLVILPSHEHGCVLSQVHPVPVCEIQPECLESASRQPAASAQLDDGGVEGVAGHTHVVDCGSGKEDKHLGEVGATDKDGCEMGVLL